MTAEEIYDKHKTTAMDLIIPPSFKVRIISAIQEGLDDKMNRMNIVFEKAITDGWEYLPHLNKWMMVHDTEETESAYVFKTTNELVNLYQTPTP